MNISGINNTFSTALVGNRNSLNSNTATTFESKPQQMDTLEISQEGKNKLEEMKEKFGGMDKQEIKAKIQQQLSGLSPEEREAKISELKSRFKG